MTQMTQQWAIFDQSGYLSCLPIEKNSARTCLMVGGAKIPHNRLWMVSNTDYAPFLESARTRAAQLNIENLWRAANGDILSAEELAQRVGASSAADSLAVLQAVLDNPAYFRRREGRLAPAAESVLHKVRAALSRRAAEIESERQILIQIESGTPPPEIKSQCAQLLCGEGKNTPMYRAVKKAAGGERHMPKWLVARGVCADARECWDLIFTHRWLARPQSVPLTLADLPAAAPTTRAFSIDDVGTFEVDDAFSVRVDAGGEWIIGIHIAAPALDDALFADGNYYERRLTSVYFPDGKHPMLSAAYINAYSLMAGGTPPALSLYCHFNPLTGQITNTQTRLEKVPIVQNYCPEDFDDGAPSEIAADYKMLCDFVDALSPLPERVRTDFRIVPAPPQVKIMERRFAGLLVEKLMRYVNAAWGQQIVGQGGLYRNGGALLPRPDPNNIYAWLSSPLRRYVDLANQRLLLSQLQLASPPKTNWRRLARAFSSQQTQARRYQDIVERHFILGALAALPSATILRGRRQDNGKVRLHDYPLAGAVMDAPPGKIVADEEIEVRLNDIDFFIQRARFVMA